MKETAAQILTRTAQRWHRIQQLDSDTRKQLMAMPEDEFEIEFQKLSKKD